jgi:hypothetical protein
MTPDDSRDTNLDEGRQGSHGRRVTGDTTAGRSDRHLSPSDRDDKPNRRPNRSSYAVTPATDRQHTTDARAASAAAPPTRRIDVEDGHVLATVDPMLTDAAADVLRRVIDKAMRAGGAP